ncbi:hypothetical protein ACMHYB_09430 [Sorangium sp. So ce1128]
MIAPRDCALSGFCPNDFELAVARLLGLKVKYNIVEVQAWDSAGRFDRTQFREGTDLRDADGVLEFDYSQMKRIAAVFRREFVNVSTNVVVELRRWRSGCIVDGMVYIEGLIEEETCAARRLEQLAAFVAEVATYTGAILISLVDEDSNNVVLPGVPVKVPRLFSAFRAIAFPELALKSALEGEVAVSWLQSPEAFLSGKPLVIEIEREVIAGLAAGLASFLSRGAISA